MTDQLAAGQSHSGTGRQLPQQRRHDPEEAGRSPARHPQHGGSARVAPTTVLLVSSFGAFLAFLDATVVNVAFPSMRESFAGASIGDLSWVLNAYNIVFASFLVIFGRLADLLGRRRLFVAGVAVFTLASVLCAIAPGLGLLVGFRALQAVGAAMLVPASLALVIEAFPSERRSHAVGLWGASAAVAAGLGPPVGGALVQLGDWRWAFLVNLPFGIAAWLLARRIVVESRAPGRRRMPDVRGALLLAAALSLLTLAIVQGNTWGWASPGILASFVGAALLTGGFVGSSRTHPQPLLDPTLLRIPAFTVANIITLVAGMGFYAYLLTNILWLQYVWQYSILEAGLALVPGALVAAVVAGGLGPFAQTHGFRRVILPGALIWASAFLWYALVVGEQPAFWSQWLPGQVLSGIGAGAVLPLLTSAALDVVPGGRFGTASAVTASTRQLGGVLGISLLVVIIGTPTATTAVEVLRDGWILSAACFVIAAAGVVFMRGGRSEAEDDVESQASRRAMHWPDPVVVPDQGGHGSYLDRLPDDVREKLLESGRRISLGGGEWLFREGESAAEMYVVASGRLVVERHGQSIRELGAGSILGELALLTGAERSASVRARRDSELLAIGLPEFTRTVADHPATGMAIATALAENLQSPSPARRERSSDAAVVSVVGLSANSPVVAVLTALESGMARHRSVASLHETTPEQLSRAEQDHARVLLHAQADSPWRDSALRQGDVIVLVARSDDEPPTPSEESGPSAQPELVLVGRAPSQEQLARWCEAAQPWQVTIAGPDRLDADLRSLCARLSGRALGLVLAGGGARSLSHIGVLHELEEAGVVVDRVAGASLGALIAGLYANDRDAAALEDSVYRELVRKRPFADYTLPVTGLAQGRRVIDGLRNAFGDQARIEYQTRQFRCASTDLIAREEVSHRSGLLWEAVAASLRLPVLFPPLRSGSRLLVDGGVLDNLPVGLLTERDEGPILAVNIGMGGEGAPRDGRPPRIPSLGETLLRTMMIGSAGAPEQARAAGAYVISPSSMGVGMLEFHQIDAMVAAGRAAARGFLEETGGSFTS